MLEYTRRTWRTGTMVVVSAFTLAACGGEKENSTLSDSGLASDSALNRDLQLAGGDTSAQPQLQDVPNAPAAQPAADPAPPVRTTTPARTTTRPAPARTTTRPAPAPRETTTPSGNVVTRGTGTDAAGSGGGGAVGTISSGTQLNLAANSRICTNTVKAGDTFTAALSESVSGSNGARIPAGANVTLRVTQASRSENVRDKISFEFAVVSVAFGGRSYALDASVASADIDRVRNQPRDKDVQKVVGGAVIGAIAGQILGKNTRGTVTGAAAGAAAGAATAAATANYEGCIGEGRRITVSLNSPLQVRV